MLPLVPRVIVADYETALGHYIDQCRIDAAARLGKNANELTPIELIRNSSLINNFIYNSRFFAAEHNPRMMRPMKAPTVRLYHFTAEAYLPVLQRDGISKGDVPVDLAESNSLVPGSTCFNNVVWLTSQIDSRRQKWASSDRNYRLTIHIDSHDSNLWSWQDLATHLGVSEATKRRMAASGGNPREWWVYVNKPILWTQVVAAEKLPESGLGTFSQGLAINSLVIEAELRRQGVATDDVIAELARGE